MKSKYKYISFEEFDKAPDGHSRFMCVGSKWNITIGFVVWYHKWNQYCFEPQKETIFSSDCLADIQHFLNQVNLKNPQSASAKTIAI